MPAVPRAGRDRCLASSRPEAGPVAHSQKHNFEAKRYPKAMGWLLHHFLVFEKIRHVEQMLYIVPTRSQEAVPGFSRGTECETKKAQYFVLA